MAVAPADRKILIVDDEPTIAATLDLIFSSQGYEVRAAHSAEEAVLVLDEWQPDLAIVDVMLPGMTGIDFGIQLRVNDPECKLLLLSGHPGTTALLEGAKQKGHEFEILAKPLHPILILEIAANLLAEAPIATGA